MKQFQINKNDLADVRIVESDMPDLASGEALLRVERFGLSANNITYAVAGDTLGYWQFFKPVDEGQDHMGIMPVWGFAEVESSMVDGLNVGERLFGYFPPATHLVIKPENMTDAHLFDGAEHRSQLPKGYNIYRRVAAEPGYDPAHDDIRMLLYPLFVTSFVIADQLEEFNHYDAKRVIIISASSKTSIGLAYALEDKGVEVIGLTSPGNREFVEHLGLYDETVLYDEIETALDASMPSVIVDMAGNADILGRLHIHFGEAMKRTLSVGLTHWEAERRSSDVIKDRTEFFFAPSRIQQRMKDWGAAEFNGRSGQFVMDTAQACSSWMTLKSLTGLEGLASVYPQVLDGTAKPQEGLLIHL